MSTNWCFQLILLHGRHDPDEILNDWGFEGPTITCIEAVHVTYSATFTVWFANQEALEAAKKVTGWSDWDRLSLEMRFHEDMLVANDQNGTRSYFGDWEFQVPEPQSPAPPT